MASRTKPLVSAAVLASVAAIAVATPALTPSVQSASPHALAAAKVQLTTFADLLALTPLQYAETLGGNGWGNAIGPNPDFDWASSYVPTNCNYNCFVIGPSGVAYMMLDALINGNGQPDPNLWNVSAVNYLFEPASPAVAFNFPILGVGQIEGPGSAVLYLAAQPFGDPTSPLFNPAVARAIAGAFDGVNNVQTAFVGALNTIAALALTQPDVGQYVYGAIQAYLGAENLFRPNATYGVLQGWPAVVQYVAEVITSGGVNPLPPPVAGSGSSAASILTAASVPAPADALSRAAAVDTPKAATTPNDTKASTPAVAEVKASIPAVAEVKESTPVASDVKPSAPTVSDVKVSVPAVSAPASTPVAVEAPSVSVPAPQVKSVEAPAVPDVKPSAPVADSTPAAPATVKDLGKEIAKTETSSAGTGSEPKSDSKAGGSHAKTSVSDVKVSSPAAASSPSEATSGASEAKAGASDAKAGGSDAGSAHAAH